MALAKWVKCVAVAQLNLSFPENANKILFLFLYNFKNAKSLRLCRCFVHNSRKIFIMLKTVNATTLWNKYEIFIKVTTAQKARHKK